MAFGTLKGWEDNLQNAPLGKVEVFVIDHKGVILFGTLETWKEFTRETDYDGNAIIYKRSMFTGYVGKHQIVLLDNGIAKWRPV